MANHIPRLWLNDTLAAGAQVAVDDSARLHHLRNVLRLDTGDSVKVFNARDGEWSATLVSTDRQRATLKVDSQVCDGAAVPQPTLVVAFAPIKREPMEWLIEKATELGAHILQPVITEHTQNRQLNAERLQGIAVSASEQCGNLHVPELREAQTLSAFLAGTDARLYVGMETLRATATPLQPDKTAKTIAILIGPEGGWSDSEVTLLQKHPGVVPFSLGSTVLRAETAVVAALSVIQSALLSR